MGSTSAWILLWSLLGLALAMTAGVLAVRALRGGKRAAQPQVGPGDSAAVKEAQDALRLRYASGAISREDYLQGKVELESDLPAYAPSRPRWQLAAVSPPSCPPPASGYRRPRSAALGAAGQR